MNRALAARGTDAARPILSGLGWAISALLLLQPQPAIAQTPTLDTIEILPSTPSTTDDISVELSGMVNDTGMPVFHGFWSRTGQDILVDLLDVEIPTLAPPVIVPYQEQVQIGQLPVGDYNVTARLFWAYDSVVIPDPWEFPDTFGVGLGGPELAPLTLTTTFRVVPEPSSLFISLSACATMLFGFRRFVGPDRAR